MPSSTVTSKGQITIPKEIRDALGLDAGDRLSFRIREDGVVEATVENVDLLSLYGILKPKVKGVSLDEMDKAIRKEASRV
jgi:AbrB family looped-hinge helix DNA binding protein